MPEEKRALTFGIHTFTSPGQGVAPVWPTKDTSYGKYGEKKKKTKPMTDIFSKAVLGPFVSARQKVMAHPNSSVLSLTVLCFLPSQWPGLGCEW